MEFLDEESRPRFLFQSRSSPTPSSLSESKTLDLHKPTIFISLSLSSLLFALSLIYLESEPLKSIIFWFALSFLLGPFAPSSITAGDIRVGVGPVIEPPPPDNEEETNPADSNKKLSGRRSKARKQDDLGFNSIPVVANNGPVKAKKSRDPDSDRETGEVSAAIVGEERDWSEADLELLKKQMVKYPVGMPGRWDAISEAFGGRHGPDSVIKAAKSTGGKKISDSDSFSRFLKDRKPVDKRVEDELAAESGGAAPAAAAAAGGGWSAGEDIALLNALKAFPKEAAMRWEKITAAVPGRSKAACMKRVADLKRDFRSSKASVEG